ncbi:deoxycytidine triphosphate deaminase [Pseudomonas phage Phabio]|uniref:Deoxycytidine triphosphate deaminase n=1 Tax=Pseudomonas phage Phabio TaxID=2006668 RepID=A0A1Y0SUD9_9CAUD|nr:dCTP deaminase [Pseudomonas phage Phabio]ARV76960.1 deoxycytidine triphosphate deaminase [Pseudomonas phage Phabio]
MSVMSDRTLREFHCGDDPIFVPYVENSIKYNEEGRRITSYGTSSYGYDLRAAGEFKLFCPPKPRKWYQRIIDRISGRACDQTIDWHDITEDMFESYVGDSIVVPPGGFLLARSLERVKIPRGWLALCIGKSTVARAGWQCLCTPIEPEWEGYITYEFQNTTNRPNKFFANEGVLQLVLFKGDQECEVSYGDRDGKYNNQPPQIVLPRV